MSTERNADGTHVTRARILQTSATIVLVALPLVGVAYALHLPEMVAGVVLWREQVGLTVLGLTLAVVFLTTSAGGQAAKRLPSWVDAMLAIVALALCLFTAVNYEDFAAMGYGGADAEARMKLAISVAIIALLLECVRRLTGLPLLILVGVAILYGFFADHLPGLLRGRAPQPETLPVYLVLDQSGILGAPLSVVVSTVLAYVLLGVALFRFGGGQMFLNLAMAVMGRFTGAPAKVSVLASALFGTVSGSAVANVATTGIVTIPMMKRAGFAPARAGAVEAVASTGGQILPPIMGAAAFIMADFLQVPYATIALSALIPALLYFVSVFAQVHLSAAKLGMKGLPASERPSVLRTLREYWPFLIPLAALVYVLFFTAQQAETAALIASALVVAGAVMRSRALPRLSELVAVLRETGKSLLDIVVVTAAAGILIGVLSITGLAFSFGLRVIEFSAGDPVVLLLVTALAALVLGMGMPTTAVYILMATLIAPALVQTGIEPIAAHLFVFYYGVLSMITPPICLAAFAAASLAQAGYMRTGFEAVRLGLVAFVVPFLFVGAPSLLLLTNDYVEIAIQVATGLCGCLLLAAATEGYFLRPLGLLLRLVAGAGGIALILPEGSSVEAFWTGYSDHVGLALGVAVVAASYVGRGQAARSGTGAAKRPA